MPVSDSSDPFLTCEGDDHHGGNQAWGRDSESSIEPESATPKAKEIRKWVEEGNLHKLVGAKLTSVEDVQALLEKYPDKVYEECKNDGCLPLHYAAYYQAKVEVINLLLEKNKPAAEKKDNNENLPLHIALKNKCNLDVVKALLDAYPDGAKAIDENGQLPLHEALRKGCGVDVVKAVIEAYQDGATITNNDGKLPLNNALEYSCSRDVVKALIEAYPGGLEKKGGDGDLPLHYAAWKNSDLEVVTELLNSYPDGAKTMNDKNRLPLHYAVRYKCDVGLVKALIEAYPDGAKKKDSDACLPLHLGAWQNSDLKVVTELLKSYPDGAKTTTYENRLPLHNAVRYKCDVGFVKLLIKEYPEGVKKKDSGGNLPLHLGAWQNSDLKVVTELLKEYPDGAKTKTDHGDLPLHNAIEHKCDEDLVKILIKEYPEGLKEIDGNGVLPITTAIKNGYSESLIFDMLKADMPLNDDGSEIKHNGSWNSIVEFDEDSAVGVVKRILSREGGDFGKHIPFLSGLRDTKGRKVLEVASAKIRFVINQYLFFCGQYELPFGPFEHLTPTSLVMRAQDHGERTDYGVVFDDADTDGSKQLDCQEVREIASSIGLSDELFWSSSSEVEYVAKDDFIAICKQHLGDGPRDVVIKLMRSKDHWERERNAREGLDSKYVATALVDVPPQEKFADEVERKNGGLDMIAKKFLRDIEIGKHAIVMHAADRNLQQIFYQEQPKIHDIRDILVQVFEALNHLHEKKLMHGDLKMLNIVRFRIDNRLRLIDFDASAKILLQGSEEKSFAGAKFSSAILPPEMIAKIKPDHVDDFNAYWKLEQDECLKEKIAPKVHEEGGVVKAHYVMKSFRTEGGEPIDEDMLPYELEHASEKIDAWSLGVLAFTLLTGEPLIPSNRDDDCASGAAMHNLYTWEKQPEFLIERFSKIDDVAARDLVMKLLQRDPKKRPQVADLLAGHPFFRPECQTNCVGIETEFEKYVKDIKWKTRFCGRYRIPTSPPEHLTPTCMVLRAQDTDERTDYNVIFNKADENKNGKLEQKELRKVAASVGLKDGVFQRGFEDGHITKEKFIAICKRHLGDGPREVVIKFMQSEEHWEREHRAREGFDIDPKYVVSVIPDIPLKKEFGDAVESGSGSLGIITRKYLDQNKPGKHAIVMQAADRNLQQIFYQEQPKIDAVREILRQLFEAVKHLHEQKLMHGDLKMLNVVRFRIDNLLRLIDFDASAKIVDEVEEGKSFAGAKFSSAILPPEMIARLDKEQARNFNKYWDEENDKGVKEKVAPKIHEAQGIGKAHYVVKTFRTVENKPVSPQELPYDLVPASENIDAWSLGVLAYILLTGEPLIPSTRDDDCASGAAMHLLYTWGNNPRILLNRYKKISNKSARDLVEQLLEREPEKRPSLGELLEEHPFFNPADETLVNLINEKNEKVMKKLEEMNTNILVIKDLTSESKYELAHTCEVLLKAIYEATEVNMPTCFIILRSELPEPTNEENEVKKELLDHFAAKADGSGVEFKSKYASVSVTAEGTDIDIKLPDEIEKYKEQVDTGMKWIKRIKKIGSKVAAGEVGSAFDVIKGEIIQEQLVGEKMYFYLVDQLTGEPVQAPGYPIEITSPSDLVPKLLPLMQVGMRAMSIYNGTAGIARMFGFPFPKVPKEWSKGSQESIEMLKKKSSVEEFGVVQNEVEGGKEESKTVRGASLRDFMEFMENNDPGLKDKKNKNGHFAGLQRIGDPEDGTALWTKLTDPEDIEKALKERSRQRREEELKQAQIEHGQALEEISETPMKNDESTEPTMTNEENEDEELPLNMASEAVVMERSVPHNEMGSDELETTNESTRVCSTAGATSEIATPVTNVYNIHCCDCECNIM